MILNQPNKIILVSIKIEIICDTHNMTVKCKYFNVKQSLKPI